MHGSMNDRMPRYIDAFTGTSLADIFPAALIPGREHCIVLDGFEIAAIDLDDTLYLQKGPNVTGIDGHLDKVSDNKAQIGTNGDSDLSQFCPGDQISTTAFTTAANNANAVVIGGSRSLLVEKAGGSAYVTEDDGAFNVLYDQIPIPIDASDLSTYTRRFRLVCAPGKSPQHSLGAGGAEMSITYFWHLEPAIVNRALQSV